MKFAERLKALRIKADLSQAELAKIVGSSKSSINMYERGEREPGLEKLEAFADFFNVDMDYLLGKSDVPNKTPLTATVLNQSETPLPHAAIREKLAGQGVRILLDADAKLTEAQLDDIVDFIKFQQQKNGR